MSLIEHTTETGHTLPAIVVNGKVRVLGARPSHKVAARRYQDHAPMVDPKDWAKRAGLKRRTDVPILGQIQNGCTGHAAARAMMCARAAAGMTFQKLSATWPYGLTNGGVDNGADPADTAKVIQDVGICLDSEVPENVYFSWQFPKSAYETAKRFMALDVYQFHTFEEAVSADLMGFYFFDTVYVGSRGWDGSTPDVPAVPGQVGNHCVQGGEGIVLDPKVPYGVKSDRGNSWEPGWADDGHFYMNANHIDHQPYYAGYAIRLVSVDPQDPNQPPA